MHQISMITFGLGTALAGASGSLVSFLFTFFPAKHMEWVTIILALIVLGGMGSLIGSQVGSFLLSALAAFVSFNFGPTWSPITFYLALFLILLFRPQGLLGKKWSCIRCPIKSSVHPLYPLSRSDRAVKIRRADNLFGVALFGFVTISSDANNIWWDELLAAPDAIHLYVYLHGVQLEYPRWL